MQLEANPSRSDGLVLLLCKGLILSICVTACADARGKKPYIDGLEKDRYSRTIQQSYQSGNRVNLTDQNGTLRQVALKDINGDGVADGIDLDGDGNLDIRILTGSEIQISPWAFIVPADIDNNGTPDYYLYMQIISNAVQIRFLTTNYAMAPQLIFVVNGSSQITGLDVTGDGVADDLRLVGIVIVTAGSAPDSTPPSQPGSPGGASGGATQIDLSWTAATDNTSAAAQISYEICQATSAGGCSTFTATYTVPAGQTNFSATGLSPLTTYYYTVRSRDASGNYGAPSGEFSATTAAAGTVNNPTYSPVAGVYASAQNVASSTTTPGATICYTTDGVTTPTCDAAAACTGGSTTYIGTVNTTVTTHFQALACLAGNTASGVVSGSFTIDTTGPSVPGSFVANPASTTQIDLSWNASTDDSTAQANIVYEICQTTTSGACSPFAVSYTTGAGATNFSATGLNALTTYYFVIRAKDSVNNTGTASGEISTTTNAIGTVTDPTYTPGAGSYAASQNVDISTITPGATICYTTDGVTTPACDASAACTTGSTYGTAINTAATTTYRAIGCKVGYTASNVAAGAFTIDTVPPTPGNSGTLTTSGVTTSAITINWTAATDNVTAQTSLEYLLYYSTANNLGSVSAIETNGTPVGSYAPNMVMQTVNTLTEGTSYYFAVIARDLMGNKAAYNVASADSHGIAGYAYAANYGSNDISMYYMDASSGFLIANGNIATGTNPRSLNIGPTGRYLYAINFNSAEISMYSINAATGSLTSIGSVAAGAEPYAMAIHPTGRFAYVINANSSLVTLYSIDATTGFLTAGGTIGAGTGTVSIALDSTGRFAYVANWTSNNVSMYTINSATGTLTAIGTVSAGTNPISITTDPSGKFAYTLNVASTDINMYTIDPITGALSANGTIAAGGQSYMISVDPTSRFAYVTSNVNNDIAIFSINNSTGQLTAGSTIATGTTAQGINIDASSNFAYVANYNSANISMYLINSSDGSLSTNGTVSAGTNPRAIVSFRKSRFAYVANNSSNDVSIFKINYSNGALVANGSIAAGSNPRSIGIHPTGKFAYAANNGSGNVNMYSINVNTGMLTSNGTIAAAGLPYSIALDKTGRFAYVSSPGSNTVSMYTINPISGVLSANGQIGTGNGPESIAIDPNGRFSYTANQSGNNVSLYTINAATGSLTANGSIAAGSIPTSVNVSGNSKFAYVANGVGNNVSMYMINYLTGVLTANGTIVAGNSPRSVASDPTSRFLYVANAGAGNNISMYTIDATNGVLTSIGTVAGGSIARSITIEATGRYAYLACDGGGNARAYTINNATGSLTANASMAAGAAPYAIATTW